MGEQLRPTGVLKSWMTTPKPAKIPAAAGAPAVVVLWQHCTGPVVHDDAGGVSLGMGVAAARIAREEMITIVENIVFGLCFGCVELLLLSIRLENKS